MIEYLKIITTPIKLFRSFIICKLLKLKPIKSDVISCLEKAGYTIMLVKEIDKNFTELKKDNQLLKQDNQYIKKQFKKLDKDNQELKEMLKKILLKK